MKAKILNLLLRRRENVVNSEPREAAVANALPPDDAIDFSDSSDGWFKIAPYGTFRGKEPGRPQVVSMDNAQAMQGEFNSLLGKLGRKFRGVPIYHGHPDVDPELWPDDRRIGKVSQLEARADGLWGYAEWNSLGESNKTEGWWIYPSPRWDAPAGRKDFSPDRLISVGLTNTPRITESEPVFNSENFAEKKNNEQEMIREKLGLPPEATDEEVYAALDALMKPVENAVAEKCPPEKPDAAAEEKAAMQKEMAAKDDELKNTRDALNNSLLDHAERETRITKAERQEWSEKLAGKEREAAVNALAGLKPKLNTQGVDLSGSRGVRAEADSVREQVSNSVAKLQAGEGLSYHDAWVKTKKKPEFKGYFEKV